MSRGRRPSVSFLAVRTEAETLPAGPDPDPLHFLQGVKGLVPGRASRVVGEERRRVGRNGRVCPEHPRVRGSSRGDVVPRRRPGGDSPREGSLFLRLLSYRGFDGGSPLFPVIVSSSLTSLFYSLSFTLRPSLRPRSPALTLELSSPSVIGPWCTTPCLPTYTYL